MNTETRARGVHSSRPGGYTHNDAEDGLRHNQWPAKPGIRNRIMNKNRGARKNRRPLNAGGFMQVLHGFLVYMN